MAVPALPLAQRALRVLLSLLPWALSLYLPYWLESRAVWEVDMPFRGVMSVVIIAIGLALSFLLHSALSRASR